MEARNGIQLYLLRHADAGDPEAWSGPDEERPLSDKGRRQSERLAAFLAGLRFRPDLIATSPKLRARETADIVAAALGLPVVSDDLLAGSVDYREVDAILEAHGRPAKAVLVGHDPDFSDLLSGLVGAGDIAMKKGALARIDIVRGIQPGGGALRWLIPPDALKGRD
jgi:phosphohistidine phosphatase